MTAIADFELVSLTCFAVPLQHTKPVLVHRLSSKRMPNLSVSPIDNVDPALVYEVVRTKHSDRGRFLLFKSLLANPEHSVLLTNALDGSSGLVCGISKDLACEAWYFRFSGKSREDYPFYQFTVFARGAVVRSVLMHREENKWQFAQTGVPLVCENQEQYERPSPKQRFSFDELLSIAEHLGVPFDSPGFWRSDEKGYLIVQDAYPESHHPTANVRVRLPRKDSGSGH